MFMKMTWDQFWHVCLFACLFVCLFCIEWHNPFSSNLALDLVPECTFGKRNKGVKFVAYLVLFVCLHLSFSLGCFHQYSSSFEPWSAFIHFNRERRRQPSGEKIFLHEYLRNLSVLKIYSRSSFKNSWQISSLQKYNLGVQTMEVRVGTIQT